MLAGAGPLLGVLLFAAPDPPLVRVQDLDREVRTFLCAEVDSHAAQVSSSGRLPDRVHGALTTGEFTWGTFMRALAATASLCDRASIGGHEVTALIARIGLREARAGGAAFTQLYAAQALRESGSDLRTNAVWQHLSAAERNDWRRLLDPTRFYDLSTRTLIDRPENYLGVAARITAIAGELGLADRTLVDSVLDRAAQPFAIGGLYADDDPPAGRFDRYSNEYARYVWEAATRAGRRDILEALRPSMRAQMRLWWDLLSEDGYGYPWGRSLGVVGYLDTMEIAAFLAAHPEVRPAPLGDLVSAYAAAWRWLRHDYGADTHLLSVFAFGRGNYAYISRDREWQQTVGAFGKMAAAHMVLVRALQREPVDAVPSIPSLKDCARFEWFRTTNRPAGVWVVRRGSERFALPFTTGPKAGLADYLPVPHGLSSFAVPVERVMPALTPFLRLEDGREVVAAGGADRIDVDADGLGVRARWEQFAVAGGAPTALVAPGFTSEVAWRLDGQTLLRDEVLRAQTAVRLSRVRLVVPSTAAAVAPGSVVVEVNGRTLDPIAKATGDSAEGRGARGHIPLLLTYDWPDALIGPDAPLRIRTTLKIPYAGQE